MERGNEGEEEARERKKKVERKVEGGRTGLKTKTKTKKHSPRFTLPLQLPILSIDRGRISRLNLNLLLPLHQSHSLVLQGLVSVLHGAEEGDCGGCAHLGGREGCVTRRVGRRVGRT